MLRQLILLSGEPQAVSSSKWKKQRKNRTKHCVVRDVSVTSSKFLKFMGQDVLKNNTPYCLRLIEIKVNSFNIYNAIFQS